VRAGLLRSRWTLQRKLVTRSASGDEVVTWSDVATIWADERPTSGTERLRDAAELAQLTTTFSIRYRNGVTPQMRVTRDSRTLDIQQVVNVDGRKRELQLVCSEVVR
jgi:SPP1 family predicted phage head-tail adaptor